MESARIAELLEPYLGSASGQRLTPNDLIDISTYINILKRWNERINLTAIRNEEEIVTRHFGESLFAARHLFPLCSPVFSVAKDVRVADVDSASAAERRQNAAHGVSRGFKSQEEEAAEQRKKITLADIGSGAGFPGIPIKLWAPQISLTLIESNHKKSTFLREVARALTLTDINILSARAETVSQTFDVVTLRAVECFDSILPVASSLVAPGGRLALLIGSAQVPSAQSALPAFAWDPPSPIPSSQSRVIAIASSGASLRQT
jgi:16S rRNA (guanine527-N7)-methyltransferase